MRTEELKNEVVQLIENYSQTKALDEGYYNGLIKKLKKEKLWEELGHVYCCMASIYANLHVDVKLAKEYLDKCSRVLKKIDSKELEVRYYSTMGIIYKVEYNLYKAIGSFNQALQILEAEDSNILKFQKLSYSIHYMLAIIFNHLGNLEKYKFNTDAADRFAAKIGNQILRAKCLYHRGEYYRKSKNLEKAKESITHAIYILENSKSQYEYGNALLMLAELYYDSKDYEEALLKFTKALEVMRLVYPNSSYCYELVKIGDSYFKLGNNEKALLHYNLAYEAAKKTYNKDMKLKTLNALQNYYRDSKDLEKVIHLLDEIAILNSEINNAERFREIAEVEEKYQSALKQKEINFRIKKQREAERYIELMEEQNKLTKNMIELLNKGLKNPVKNGKQMLDVLNRGGLNAENKTKIIKNIHEYFGQIEQFSKDVKEIIQSDSKEALGEKLDASRIISLVNKNLAGKTDEYDLDRSKYPKTYFIQEHVSRLAKNSEQSTKLFPLLQARSVGVLI